MSFLLSRNVIKASFDSAAFTKPTGTAITSAGTTPSLLIRSMIEKTAVGAFPIATTPPDMSAKDSCMDIIARVLLVSLAFWATTSSAILQTIFPPNRSITFALIPALTMFTSVTIDLPVAIAFTAASTAIGLIIRLSAKSVSPVA